MKQNENGLWSEVVQLVKHNIRDYMMYIALIVIMAFFSFKTNGGFISARNIINLINQSGYVAILAIGMTLILIIKHIDLSVGYVAGFAGAVSAILMTQYKMNEWLAILIALLIGLIIGIYQGLLVTRLKVPADFCHRPGCGIRSHSSYHMDPGLLQRPSMDSDHCRSGSSDLQLYAEPHPSGPLYLWYRRQ